MATFADIPSAGSDLVSECEELVWPVHQLSYFHQILCVLAPIPVGSCCILSVSPGIDGSPWLIWKLSGSCQGPRWLPDSQNEYRCSYLCSLFCVLHYADLDGIHFSLVYCGVEPKTEAVPPSQAPSVHPSTSAFLSPVPICVPDQAPFFVWVEPVLPFTFVNKLNCECLVVYIPQKHTVRPHLKVGFYSIS